MIECPFCGHMIAATHMTVQQHTWEEHRSSWRCWCGETLEAFGGEVTSERAYNRHVNARGGYEQHYTDCLMGALNAEAS